MNAWDALKREMTKGTKPGSVGEFSEIDRAARAFMAVLPYLRDREAEETAFNADPDIIDAILAARMKRDLGF